MIRKYKLPLLISMALANVSVGAIPQDVIDRDLESKSMIQRKVGTTEEYFEYTVYHRNSSERPTVNSDYFYVWNGRNQTVPELMNQTGLLEDAEEVKRSAMFIGGTHPSDDWSDAAFQETSTSLNYMGSVYKNTRKDRRQIGVGYDYGVAHAYRFACEQKHGVMILSQGGLFEDEQCSPRNTEVISSINMKGERWPYNQSDVGSIDMGGRLDGDGTSKKLIELLKCSPSGVQSTTASGVSFSYDCSSNNKLIILQHDSAEHQWNGYVNGMAGFAGMYGDPVQPPLINWLKSELHVE
ncbi:conserved exported hypothetical protein [Vibrio chagasii]|nr:conserved exported hypothetical protein [Vibrio chagasii]